MKFATSERLIQSTGSIKSSEITLSSNAKAFRLIFGQIYPDIIKAIVREIFTNAWDSQKLAGKLDTPIEIHAPNAWEPWFSVRDFGVGMSPETIENIYARVFESTKDTSNDEAGMFGMGSKTPLGYTDNFVIVSYQGGRYWYYEMYINTKGGAQIDLKDEGETDEPDGVMVQLAVKLDDMKSFEQHINHFVLGANTPVNINGERFKEVWEVLSQGEGWQIVKTPSVSGPHIRMGCVLYKVNNEFIRNCGFQGIFVPKRNGGYYTGYNYYGNDSSRIPVVIDFPIGTFDVTGSREDIIYNQEVAQRIVDRADEIIEDVKKELAAELATTKTRFEAYSTIGKVMAKVPLFQALIDHLKWKSYKIRTRDYSYSFSNFSKRLKGIQFSPLPGGERKTYNFRPAQVMTVGPQRKQTLLVEYAGMDKPHLRIREYFENVVSVSSYDREHFKWIRLESKEVMDSFAFKKLKVLLGDPTVVDLSTIAKYKRPKSSLPPASIIDKAHYIYSMGGKWHTNITQELVDGAYYVPATRNTFDDGEWTVKAALNWFKPNDCEVFVIRPSTNHFIKKYNLVNMIEAYNDAIANFNYTDEMINKMAWEQVSKQSMWDREKVRRKFKVFDFDMEDCKVGLYDIPQDITDKVHKRKTELTEEMENVYLKNPLLSFFNTYSTTTDAFDEAFEQFNIVN